MAVNEKIVYAAAHTTYAGKYYRPGDQLTGRMPDAALRHAQEGGLTTDSHTVAERAKGAEMERVRDVQRQIESRSEKRGQSREQ